MAEGSNVRDGICPRFTAALVAVFEEIDRYKRHQEPVRPHLKREPKCIHGFPRDRCRICSATVRR